MCFKTTDKNDRVMIFLDLANIELSFKSNELFNNSRIDHDGLAKILIDGRKVTGAMVFDSSSYFDTRTGVTKYLSRIGYKIVAGAQDDLGQKEVDVSIATEMLMHAFNDHYDVAILLTGDRDFIPAVTAVQLLGKTVEVASFSSSTSHVLMNVSDKYTSIESLPIVDYLEPYVNEDVVSDNEIFTDVMDLIDVEESEMI